MKKLYNGITCCQWYQNKSQLWLEKQGFSPANKLPWSLTKRGTSQQNICIKNTWKRRKKYHTGHSSSLNRPLRIYLGLVILCAAFHSAQKMSIGKCWGPLVEIFHSFALTGCQINIYILPTNKLLEVSVENIVENTGRHSNNSCLMWEKHELTGHSKKVTETREPPQVSILTTNFKDT